MEAKHDAITLRQAIRRYLRQTENPNTKAAYEKTLAAFADGYGGDRLLTSFDEDDIDEWDAAVRQRDLADATINTHRKRMKSFWNWCVKRGYVEASPARFLTIRKDRASRSNKAIPTGVLRAMLEVVVSKRDNFIACRDAAILSLLVTYGARRGDVARLTLDRVDFAGGWICFRVKGGADHRLPLLDQPAELLLAWHALRAGLDPDPVHEAFFVNNRLTPPHRYGPLSAESISSIVKRLSHEVSGRYYGPHAIRHWRGQSLMDNRVPVTIIADVLGHSNPRITLAHYGNQDGVRVANILADTSLTPQLPKPKMKRADPDDPRLQPDWWRRAN